MKIVVGLGNPGPKYETTRHNAGFLAVDRLIEAWKARGPERGNQAEVYQAEFDGEKILILKPQTYMNLSGRAVAPVFNFYKCSVEDLIVIHDDLDLAPAAIRIKTGGGNAGHNGLKSIDASIGKNGYHRIRLGIGRPAQGSPVETVDYVLQLFSHSELKEIDALLDQVVVATQLLVQGKASEAMNRFNGKKKD